MEFHTAEILIRQNLRSQTVTSSGQFREKLGEHDAQLNQIYDALENMLDEKAAQRKWDNRERIGFKR